MHDSDLPESFQLLVPIIKLQGVDDSEIIDLLTVEGENTGIQALQTMPKMSRGDIFADIPAVVHALFLSLAVHTVLR